MTINTRPGTYRVPGWAMLTSMLGLGPIPFTMVFRVQAMVHEANTNPFLHDDQPVEYLTAQETATRSRALGKAQRRIEKATKPVEKLAKQVQALGAEINLLDQFTTTRQDRPMVGAAGEYFTPDEAKHEHSVKRERIHDQTEAGSKEHILVHSHALRDYLLLAIDLPIFAFAMLGLFNVRLTEIGADFGTILKAGTALVFALLGTVLLAVTMHKMGAKHRVLKGADGNINAPQSVKRRTQVELAGLLVIVGLAAGVMAARVVLEGVNAEAPWSLVISLAGLFATLIAAAAYLNYRGAYDNGSILTDAVTVLGNQLTARDLDLEKLKNTSQVKVSAQAVTQAKLQRLIERVKADATRLVINSAADKSIRLARGYHGHASQTRLPAPDLDFAALDLAYLQTQTAAPRPEPVVNDAPPLFTEVDFYQLTDKEL